MSKILTSLGVKSSSRERDNNEFRSSYQYSHDRLLSLTTKDYLRMYRWWVNTCVTTICDSVVWAERHLENEKWEKMNHPYEDLVTSELLRYIAWWLEMAWEVYIRKVLIWQKVVRLVWLRPDLVKPKVDNNWIVTWYEYNKDWKIVHFEKEEIICFKNYNPNATYPNTLRWYGTVQAAAMTITLDYESEKWNANWFNQSAQAGTILKTDKQMDEKTMRRLKEQWNSKYSGWGNAHRLAILDNGMTYQDVKASQKEMDFVASQRWNMEKILAIFKVPKAIIGMWEWVNVWNVDAFDRNFAKRKILPLVTYISEVLSKELFVGVWIYKFVNVVPLDPNETRNNYLYNIITKNEARMELWYNRDKDWDIYNDWTWANVEEQKSISAKPEFSSKERLWKSIKWSIKWTEEYYEQRATKRMSRIWRYEKRYISALERIFDVQQRDILEQYGQKSAKSLIPNLWKRYIALYLSILRTPQKELLEAEWKEALDEIGVQEQFNLQSPDMVSLQKENIIALANSIDSTTDESMRKVVKEWLDWWLSPAQIQDSIKWVFTKLKRDRLKTIVRTETIRISSQWQQRAWEQSWVVTRKKWYTTQNERVCQYCEPMHWKVIWLREKFYEKWDKLTWRDWWVIDLNYSDTKWPPIHVNCSCSLIPILD